MKSLKCIFLIISVVLTDSASATEQSPSNLNFTAEFNNAIVNVSNLFIPYWKGIFAPSSTDNIRFFILNNTPINEILYNVTLKFQKWPQSKVEMPSKEDNTFKIFAHLTSFVIEGCLKISNTTKKIVTEPFTLNCTVKSTVENNKFEIDTGNFDQSQIQLTSLDSQFKPEEEAQIKKEMKTYIKFALKDIFSHKKSPWNRWKVVKSTYLYWFDKFLNNKRERYYFIGTIPSTQYALNNVTIYGLWNAQTILSNVFNLADFPEIRFGSIRGSLVQTYDSLFDELSFKADNIYISFNQKAIEVNVKIEGYSISSKLNTTWIDDQSKFIIEKIELAFAASIESAWKSSDRILKIVEE